MPATSCRTGSASSSRGGILQRTPDPSDKRKVVYSLTPKGEALMPVVLALRQWGEDWGSGPADIVLVDRESGVPVRKICVESEDGRVLKKHEELVWVRRAEAQPRKRGARPKKKGRRTGPLLFQLG